MTFLHRYTHIVVDTVQTRGHARLDVMFVATLEGVIKKLVRVPGTNQTCVIEEIHLASEDQQLPIRSMKLVKEQVRGCVESKGACRDSASRVPTDRQMFLSVHEFEYID